MSSSYESEVKGTIYIEFRTAAIKTAKKNGRRTWIPAIIKRNEISLGRILCRCRKGDATVINVLNINSSRYTLRNISLFFLSLSLCCVFPFVLPGVLSCTFAPCSWQRGLILIDLSGSPARRKLAIFDISTAQPRTIRYRGTGRDNEMIDHATGDRRGRLRATFDFKVIL